jgi:hypothetical protein
MGLVVAEALILIALYFHWFYPKDYPRNYLEYGPPEWLTLAEIATSKNFYI